MYNVIMYNELKHNALMYNVHYNGGLFIGQYSHLLPKQCLELGCQPSLHNFAQWIMDDIYNVMHNEMYNDLCYD